MTKCITTKCLFLFITCLNKVWLAALNVPSINQLWQEARTSAPSSPMKMMILVASGLLLSCFTVLLSSRKVSRSDVIVSCSGSSSKSSKDFGLGGYFFMVFLKRWILLLIFCLCDMKEAVSGIFVSKFTMISPQNRGGPTVGMRAAALIFSSSTSRTFLSTRRLLWVWLSAF